MFRIILTFILIYLIFRLLTTYILPLLVKWYLKRFKKQFYRDNPWHSENEPRRREGEVRISGTPPEAKQQGLGEYVDYEEIKEPKKEDDKKNNKK
jgi:hypothetical protein